MSKQIIIRGANENNLKNISLKIPKNKLVVFTGLSVQVKHRWLSIPFMPKVSVAILKACRPMPDNFGTDE